MQEAVKKNEWWLSINKNNKMGESVALSSPKTIFMNIVVNPKP
jgi:hypothetical protein